MIAPLNNLIPIHNIKGTNLMPVPKNTTLVQTTKQVAKQTVKVAKSPFNFIQTVHTFFKRLENKAHGATYEYNEEGQLIWSHKPNKTKHGDSYILNKYYTDGKIRQKEKLSKDTNIIFERKDYNEDGTVKMEVHRNLSGRIITVKIHEYHQMEIPRPVEDKDLQGKLKLHKEEIQKPEYETRKLHTTSEFDLLGLVKRTSKDMANDEYVRIEEGPNKTIVEPRGLGHNFGIYKPNQDNPNRINP